MTQESRLYDMAYPDCSRTRKINFELRAALRALRAQGLRFDAAEIAAERADALALCYELTRLYGIPCTFDPGVPLHFSKAARTLHCWLGWIADGCNGTQLIRMMYDGIPAPQDSLYEGVRGGRLQMASLLRKAGIGSGRDSLLDAVDRSIDQLREEAAKDETRRVALHQALANRAWLVELLVITPAPASDGTLSLHSVASGARRLALELCRDAYPGEELALARIAELMAQVLAAEDLRLAANEAARRIDALVRKSHFLMVLQSPGSEAIATASPMAGHLHVTSRSAGSDSGQRVRFTVGRGAGRAHGSESGADRWQTPPSPPLSPAERWLGECMRRDHDIVWKEMREWNPLLREGARAMEARAAGSFTVWDGNCGPGSTGRGVDEFSDSTVRLFAHCPYAFFLESLLEVKAPPPWRNPTGSLPASSALPGGVQGSLPDTAAIPALRGQVAAALAAGSFPHASSPATCVDCPFRDICAVTAADAIPELWHFQQALRILTDPEDPVPVLAFLRGPFCGADDPALLAYRRAGGRFAFNARAIPGTDERIAAGLQYIKDTVRLVRSNPPGTVVLSMAERLALHAVIACSPSGWAGVEMLEEFIAAVQHWSTAGHSIPEIVDLLEAALRVGSFAVRTGGGGYSD